MTTSAPAWTYPPDRCRYARCVTGWPIIPTTITPAHAVWRELVLRARLDGPQWVIAAVGMAMPLLVRVAHEVCEDFHGDPTDVDAQILTGFLDALRNRINLERDDPYHELHDAAQRAGRRCAHTPLPHRAGQ